MRSSRVRFHLLCSLTTHITWEHAWASSAMARAGSPSLTPPSHHMQSSHSSIHPQLSFHLEQQHAFHIAPEPNNTVIYTTLQSDEGRDIAVQSAEHRRSLLLPTTASSKRPLNSFGTQRRRQTGPRSSHCNSYIDEARHFHIITHSPRLGSPSRVQRHPHVLNSCSLPSSAVRGLVR